MVVVFCCLDLGNRRGANLIHPDLGTARHPHENVPSRARLGRQLGWSREEKLAVLGQTAAKATQNLDVCFDYISSSAKI